MEELVGLVTPQNTKHGVNNPAIHCKVKMKISVHIKTQMGMFIAALFIILEKWKKPKWS
jgi:hypothetical protein